MLSTIEDALSRASMAQVVPQIALWIAVLLTLRFLVVAIYNVFLHPLKSVPGPFSAKIFPQYLMFAVIKGHKSQTLATLHKKYGTCIRTGPNEVSISDYRVYRQIFNQTSSLKEDSFYKAATLIGHENIFTMRNKEQHSARRKMQNGSYSQKAVNESESLIMEMVTRLLGRIRSESLNSGSKTANVYSLCGLFSVEVICQAAFNHDLDSEFKGKSLEYLQSMDECNNTLVLGALFPPLLTYKLGEYLPGQFGHAFRQRGKWERITREMLIKFQQREKSLDSEQFIASSLINKNDDFLGRKLSNDESVEEAMGLAFAGSGTTAITLVYILYHLSRPENRAMQLRLRKEVLSTGPTLSEVRDLPYLNAVIKEAMRLNPSLMGSLPRTLTAAVTVGSANDLVLPQGTTVIMQNYVHQRDPLVCSNPTAFDPEQWIGQDSSSSLEKALTPFSLGPRNCIGQNLARTELLLAVSQIARHLNWNLNPVMKESDMDMEDRLVGFPKNRKLILDVEEL